MQTTCQPAVAPATAAEALGRNSLDNALLRSIAEGDKGAMQVLFQRHSVRIYRFALRLVADAALAEDIVSEVFIDVWRGAGNFKAKSQVTTWLLAIARNKAISTLRRRLPTCSDAPVAVDLVDPSDDPELAMYHRDRAQIMRACLARLSPPHREVIDLVYYHERSIDEAAQIVGVSRNTIKSRVLHARRQMAKLLAAVPVEIL